ncbi:hypothetical protein [Sphingomonas sp. OV641]|uniref:hypothetical protein n=1 Tax=Sphingomonas sp. OV641 TaxID=1881068 RepID=UPI00115FF79E|nr:hypothetical protein [Sphingomonas sp. OV641]
MTTVTAALRPVANIGEAIYRVKMLTFTHLERSILDAICLVERPSIPGLQEILSTATVVSRDNTGHGFYTKFRTAPLQDERWENMIPGPIARMLDMGEDALMGFILWCSEQGSNTLEGFQLGDSAGDTVDLKTRDLGALRFSDIGY